MSLRKCNSAFQVKILSELNATEWKIIQAKYIVFPYTSNQQYNHRALISNEIICNVEQFVKIKKKILSVVAPVSK